MSKTITPLRRAIFESGRTQKSIAEAVGISEAHLSRVCNGLHVNSETQARIAHAIGRRQSELFPSGDGHGLRDTPDDDGLDAAA